MKTFYYVEITDTFGGEANYSWVTRHVIRATTMRGAITKLAKRSGISWRCVDSYSDQARYDSKSGATCCFIEPLSTELHGYLDTVSQTYLNTDDRETA